MSVAPTSTRAAAMTAIFSTNTHVTLFFTEWTTKTPAIYFATLLILVFLGVLNRFLGAVRSQLERKWKVQSDTARISWNQSGASADTDEKRSIWGTVRLWAIGSQPAGKVADEEEWLSPKPPASVYHDEKNDDLEKNKFWVAKQRWSLKRDGIRALLEFLRALIASFLMLTIMSFNVGFLFAVTGSVLFGELLFARF